MVLLCPALIYSFLLEKIQHSTIGCKTIHWCLEKYFLIPYKYLSAPTFEGKNLQNWQHC